MFGLFKRDYILVYGGNWPHQIYLRDITRRQLKRALRVEAEANKRGLPVDIIRV